MCKFMLLCLFFVNLDMLLKHLPLINKKPKFHTPTKCPKPLQQKLKFKNPLKTKTLKIRNPTKNFRHSMIINKILRLSKH